MAKRRNKLEVTRDILEVLKKNKKVGITNLIYRANLSTGSIKPHLEELIKNRLIKKDSEGGRTFFSICKKGLEFLEEFEKMRIFSEAYGL